MSEFCAAVNAVIVTSALRAGKQADQAAQKLGPQIEKTGENLRDAAKGKK